MVSKGNLQTFTISALLVVTTVILALVLPPISSLASPSAGGTPESFLVGNINHPPPNRGPSGVLVIGELGLVPVKSSTGFQSASKGVFVLSNETRQPIAGASLKIWPGTNREGEYLLAKTNSSGYATITLAPGVFTVEAQDMGVDFLLPVRVLNASTTEAILTIHAVYYSSSFYEIPESSGAGWVQPWDAVYATLTGATNVTSGTQAYLSPTAYCLQDSLPCFGPSSQDMLPVTVTSLTVQGAQETLSVSPVRPFPLSASDTHQLFIVAFGISAVVSSHAG